MLKSGIELRFRRRSLEASNGKNIFKSIFHTKVGGVVPGNIEGLMGGSVDGCCWFGVYIFIISYITFSFCVMPCRCYSTLI